MIDWIKEKIEDAEIALSEARNKEEQAFAKGRLFELRDVLQALESQI